MRALVCLVAACAVAPPPVPATHPANRAAPVGRLAGPPATLRVDVVRYTDVPALRAVEPPPMHHHHGS